MSESISYNIAQLKDAPLFKFVTSYRNIYRAIYALESYIDELYLLDTTADRSDAKNKTLAPDSPLYNKSDLELYYILHDKFNIEVIDEVIKLCKARIEEVITKSDDYFLTSVYFSLKKYDREKEKVKFRPLHTASLIDQICMVAMLQVLMFEDSDEVENATSGAPRRFPSDLLKSIPDNFYGNRGSLKLERIYEKWVPNYQAYNRKIVDSCDEYSKSHKYDYEVSLDIMEFFPSVSPFYLFVKICDVLKEKYRKDLNKNLQNYSAKEKNLYNLNLSILKRITAKLLFLKIKDSGMILDQKLEYYGEEGNYSNEIIKSPTFFAKGIAQGLPQSYFFGNLCMTDVRRKIMSDNMFKGKDYFYVDDSVIYVRSSQEDIRKNFDNKIRTLNMKLKSLTSFNEFQDHWENVTKDNNTASPLLMDMKECGGTAAEFHMLLEENYQIKFHDKEKSKIQTIDEANREIKSMGGLGRNVSGMSSFFMDADDRRISSDKMKALNDYAWIIITEIEEEQKKKDGEHQENKEDADDNKNVLQLKLFKRFRKIFLSRNMWLDTMDSGQIDDALEKWFLILLSPEGADVRNGFSSPIIYRKME